MVKMITSMKNALHLYYPQIKVIQTDKIIIKSPIKITCNIDGEKLTSNNFKINIIKNGLQIYYDQDLIDDILNK